MNPQEVPRTSQRRNNKADCDEGMGLKANTQGVGHVKSSTTSSKTSDTESAHLRVIRPLRAACLLTIQLQDNPQRAWLREAGMIIARRIGRIRTLPVGFKPWLQEW